ncbi:MAG: signal peptide peptidase SppA [Flavisolibacter sp.]
MGVFVVFFLLTNLATKSKPALNSKSVLVVDLGSGYRDHIIESPFSSFSEQGSTPSLFDVVRLIANAKTDTHIAGIFLSANENSNGFASSNELRMALKDFRTSGKFIMAYGDRMSQKAYFVANTANKIYINPNGSFDWRGFDISFAFIKGMLDKLEIHPQIFYAGKFKSATEMFRTDKMTPENKLQTTVWLSSLYNYFLIQTSLERKMDTGILHRLANDGTIQRPQDAVNSGLIDAVKFDDEVKDELKKTIGLGKTDKLNFISINQYGEAVSLHKSGSDRIALILAEGDIVEGMGTSENIGGDNYQKIIRKARLDNRVKAIVLRVNSGGGSALASDKIWRELTMARAQGKPVIVSFGDVAASGGYYISCGADSIFASPNTITGSIGVFGIVPDMGSFFKNKLGITFDGVKTAPFADEGAIYRPLNEVEKIQLQKGIDRTYTLFKLRVASGRKKDITYIDSIAQGRVWSGEDGLKLGLVDRIGNLQQAINCAARMGKTHNYALKSYPESESWLDNILGKKKTEPQAFLEQQLGQENFRIFKELTKIKEMTQSVQARMPFTFFIH